MSAIADMLQFWDTLLSMLNNASGLAGAGAGALVTGAVLLRNKGIPGLVAIAVVGATLLLAATFFLSMAAPPYGTPL